MKSVFLTICILNLNFLCQSISANPNPTNSYFQPLPPLIPLESFDQVNEALLPKENKECVLEEPDILKKSKSPLDGTIDLVKKNNIFFNLQFMATGKNGEPSFQSVPVPRINLKEFVTAYSKATDLERQDVLKLSQNQMREILLSGVTSLEGTAKENSIDNALLIYKLSQIKNEKLMYQTLQTEMKSQSFARKVDFLANLLSYLMDNYDITSAQTDSSAIKITDMEMMAAIGESIRTGKKLEAGVCRHMHQLAIKMAGALGIDNAYTVAYTTKQLAHMTLIMQDPKDPKKVIQLNYGTKSETDGVTGPEALSQNHGLPSNGIVFKIFNQKDQFAISLPSELGGILNRVTGGEDQDLSPDYKSRSQFQQVGVETPYGTVRFFHTESPLGNQEEVSGGAYNFKLKYNDLFYGEFGISGFTSSRPVENGKLKSKGIYGRTTQGMNLKIYSSNDLQMSLFSELHLRGTLFCSTDTSKECEGNFDQDESLTSGAKVNYKIGETQNTSSLIFQNQSTPNYAVVDQNLVLETPVLQFRHDTKFKLTPNLEGIMGGELTSYQIGPGFHGTYNTHLGLNEKKSKIFLQFNLDGRVTPNTPIWIPDAEHSVNGIIGASIFNDSFYINLDGRKSLEIDGNYFLGVGIGGNTGK